MESRVLLQLPANQNVQKSFPLKKKKDYKNHIFEHICYAVWDSDHPLNMSHSLGFCSLQTPEDCMENFLEEGTLLQ